MGLWLGIGAVLGVLGELQEKPEERSLVAGAVVGSTASMSVYFLMRWVRGRDVRSQ